MIRDDWSGNLLCSHTMVDSPDLEEISPHVFWDALYCHAPVVVMKQPGDLREELGSAVKSFDCTKTTASCP